MSRDNIHFLAAGLQRPFFITELSRKALEPVSTKAGSEVLYSSIIPLLVRRSDGTVELPLGVPYGALARIARLLNAAVTLGGGNVKRVYLVLPVRLEFETADVTFTKIARQAAWLAAVARNVNLVIDGRPDLPSIEIVFDGELIERYGGADYQSGKHELNDAVVRTYGPHQGMVRVLSAHQVSGNLVADDGTKGGTKKGLGFAISPTSTNLKGEFPSHDAVWDPNEGKGGRVKLIAEIDPTLNIPEVFSSTQVGHYSGLRSMVSLIEMGAWIDPSQFLNRELADKERALRATVGELRQPSELSSQQLEHAASCRDLVLDGLSRLSVLAPNQAEIDNAMHLVTASVEAHA